MEVMGKAIGDGFTACGINFLFNVYVIERVN